MTNSILNDLRWRYATKQFDPTKKVSEHDLQELLEELRLSASSFGLQPWKFLVVTDTTAFDKILGLEKMRLTTAVLCPISYRSADDNYATAAKVRFGVDDVVLRK